MPFFNLPTSGGDGSSLPVLTGDGSPSNAVGADGQLYIDKLNGTLFVKEGGSWGNGISVGGAADWSELTGKPSTFPPASHTHSASEISDFATAAALYGPVVSVNGQTGTVTIPPTAWSDITDKPSTFAPSAHNHTAANITDFATQAALYGPVTSVNGQTGAVVVSGGGALSDALPQPLGTASAGTSSEAARADHVHGTVPIDGGDFVGGPLIEFTTNPQNQTASNGSATFSVAATSAIGPISWQWQESVNNGASWANVAAATQPTLALTGLVFSDNGKQYRAVASAGSVIAASTAATLTIAASEDVYTFDTLALLHLDGNVPSYTFTDSSSNGRLFSKYPEIQFPEDTNDAVIDNQNARFGQSLRVSSFHPYRAGIQNTHTWFGSSAQQQQWTIEFWFYSESLTGAFAFPIVTGTDNTWHDGIEENWQASLLASDFGIGIGQAGLRVILGQEVVEDTDGLAAFLGTSQSQVAIDQWHHFAIVRDGAVVRLFHNGALRKSATLQNTNTLQSQAPIHIGGAKRFSSVFQNLATSSEYWLDEFKISNTALYANTFIVRQTAYPNPTIITVQSGLQSVVSINTSLSHTFGITAATNNGQPISYEWRFADWKRISGPQVFGDDNTFNVQFASSGFTASGHGTSSVSITALATAHEFLAVQCVLTAPGGSPYVTQISQLRVQDGVRHKVVVQGAGSPEADGDYCLMGYSTFANINNAYNTWPYFVSGTHCLCKVLAANSIDSEWAIVAGTTPTSNRANAIYLQSGPYLPPAASSAVAWSVGPMGSAPSPTVTSDTCPYGPAQYSDLGWLT